MNASPLRLECPMVKNSRVTIAPPVRCHVPTRHPAVATMPPVSNRPDSGWRTQKRARALSLMLLSAALLQPLVAAPTAALAHSDLVSTVPHADAGGEAGPSVLRLRFSESVERAFSD